MDLLSLHLPLVEIDFLLFFLLVIVSDHSVHKVSVFDEYVAISFEKISALVSPYIQHVVINLTQLSSAANLFNLLEYVLA